MGRNLAAAVLARLLVWVRNNQALVVILALAAFFRLFRFDEVPLAISHDVALNAVAVEEVLRGKHAVFFDVNIGIEPLMIYLQAASVALLGMGPEALRLPAAIAGIATVLCVYLLVRLLFSARVAAFAALGVAVTFWPVFVSRIGLRAVTLPLVETLAFYFLWRGLKKGGKANFALAGFFLGGSLYTYLSGRFVPLVAVALLAYTAIRLPSRRLWTNVAICMSVAVLTALPIGHYFWTNGESFARRASQVNDLRFIVESRDFGPLLTDSLNTLGMFAVRGDPSSRYNLAGRPVFDPLSAALFAVGLVVVLRRLWKTARSPAVVGENGRSPLLVNGRRSDPDVPAAEGFLLLWLAVMLLPSATTGESPHFWRAVGAIPPTFALLGIGVDALWRFVESRRPFLARSGLPMATALVFSLAGLTTSIDYFWGWAADAEAMDIYRADMKAIAIFVDGWDGRGRLLISAEYPYDLDRYVLTVLREGRGTEATWFDGRQVVVLPNGDRTEAYYFFPSFAMPPRDILHRYFQPAQAEAGGASSLYRLKPDAITSLTPAHPSAMSFGPLELLGYDVAGDDSPVQDSRAGQLPVAANARDRLTITLYWRVRDKPEADAQYSFFVHLIGSWGRMWSQKDISPYPPENWRVGDVFLNRHEISILPGTPPNPYAVEAGVYSRKSGARLQTAEGNDRLRIEGVMVVPPPTGAGRKDLGIPHPLAVEFEDGISLVGYDLTPPILKAGESVELTYFWESKNTPAQDYTVFNHLLDEKGAMVSQKDSQPADGFYPTSRWRAGELVRDKYTLLVPADLPAGEYRIAFGLYSAQTTARLKVVGRKPGLPQKADHLLGWLSGRKETVEGDRVLLQPIVVRNR